MVLVYKGVYNGKEVAIKGYTPRTQTANVERILNKMKFCQAISDLATTDNCFLKCYGSCYLEGTCYLVMEYMKRDLMIFLTQLLTY